MIFDTGNVLAQRSEWTEKPICHSSITFVLQNIETHFGQNDHESIYGYLIKTQNKPWLGHEV